MGMEVRKGRKIVECMHSCWLQSISNDTRMATDSHHAVQVFIALLLKIHLI